ncbi:GNAT family N-acetyltransferase [Chitinophaga sancti]|uniref:GNAT family N-acetyltransferase n=1 Tax=Chitinophaga sancti TaxID=1004 RepID=A0A1K1R7R0_9BACT|nr:GNAT family N-acetyltransferase [Chitinophaga sancti]WQD64157.1 GNAT family N-acetyltransferase [Chitinophaga sancti]WQG90219.1 GNAT family N-acetyltransferase [Chitinophaga sancti]SFW67859.1 Protein N-acetyltransferase, RimJ/RimL family [Chitinophaga sancti]
MNKVRTEDGKRMSYYKMDIFAKRNNMPPVIQLRKTIISDLAHFFTFQLDQEANYLAAFTAKDPGDREAYLTKYAKFVDDPTIHMCTILVNDVITGSIAKFVMHGDAEVTYWIDKAYWGQGIATAALRQLLNEVSTRPIFGRAAFDNIGSQRVLEKCGFVKVGTDKGFANARQAEVEEVIYKLVY